MLPSISLLTSQCRALVVRYIGPTKDVDERSGGDDPRQSDRGRPPESPASGPVWGRNGWRFGLVLLLITSNLLGLPGRGTAQTLQGVLLERGTDRPVDLALLTLLTLDGDSVTAVLSDAEGRFSLEADDPGDYLLNAVGLGYRSSTTGVFELGDGGRISVEFRLEPVPIEIGGVEVLTESVFLRRPALVQNGFVERAMRGFGRFITPQQIRNSGALSIGDLLARTGRVSVQYSIHSGGILMRGPRGFCRPRIFLDGVLMPEVGGRAIESIASLSMLEAVEVYRSGTEAPLQYGANAGECGVILLWTLRR